MTAVEWLVNVWALKGSLCAEDIVKAKQMEKKQIIDAYLKDRKKVTIDKVLVHLDKAEEYYETIKTRTNDSKTTI